MTTTRSTLYHCLAEALADPPDWLALPGSAWPLFEAALALARESQAARQAVEALLEIEAEPLEERRARYMRIFRESGRRSLGLYESGALRGRLLTAETFAVERWYQQAGLSISGAELPDHASLELAFLAFLSEAGMADLAQVEAAFLRQHAARWLPSLGRSMAASGDPLYAPVGRLLSGWLEEVCVQLGVPGFSAPRSLPHSRRAGGLPIVANEDACTLCSFCVQSCPTGALAINETDSHTGLYLAAERCIGCGRCARACLAGALEVLPAESAPQPATGEKTLLRQSARAACKVCGAALVSQAELAYVAECLGNPGWLDCCPDCRAKSLGSSRP